jgi:tRNA dimethylallyltransferase
VGKTELCLTLADLFHTPIISADSRQMYADIPICTAAPTPAERERVEHYLVGNLSLDDYYSAARYEEDVLSLADKLFVTHDILLVTGGSMMYIDALCYGIDQIPTIPDDIRQPLLERYGKEGLEPLVQELRILDPDYYKEVDRKNPKRVIHALEVCYLTGHPYSDLRKGQKAERPFRIVRIGLTRPREELYERINRRVDLMVSNGLLDEARRMYPRRGLNSLNTVGMKEMFTIFDGTMDRHTAIERMKKNTRVYAKKQLTWYRRDSDITWVSPDDAARVALSLLSQVRDNRPI